MFSSEAAVRGASGLNAPLFQTERSGDDFHITVFELSTTAPLSIELGFAELRGALIGERVFDVDLNGKPILENFDIVAAGGGQAGRAIIRKFNITPRSGSIDLHFAAVSGTAGVCYVRLRGKGIDQVVVSGNQHGESSPTDTLPSWDADTAAVKQTEQIRTWQNGVPFGGIGTGGFTVLPNGRFANFTMNNSWDYPARKVRGIFLGVSAKSFSGGGTARMLRVREPLERPTDYYGARTFPTAVYRGQFPKGEWVFQDDTFPLIVRSTIFTPFIPGDEADSGIPAAIISVELKNPRKSPVSTSVVFSWDNISGFGGSRLPGDQFDIVPRLTHSDFTTTGIYGVRLAADAPAEGRRSTFLSEYAAGVETSGTVVTRVVYWDPRGRNIPWWAQFADSGRLDRRDKKGAGEWRSGDASQPAATALSASYNLAPGEKRTANFIVAWHAPSIVANAVDGNTETFTQDYAKRWGSAVETAAYVAANRERLTTATAAWHDAILKSNLPQWLKSQLANAASPVATNSVHFSGGQFALLESPEETTGSLGALDLLPETHGFLAGMFPRLAAVELDLYGIAQQPDGRIPRTLGNLHGKIRNIDSGAPEYTCAWVMMVARHYRATADAAFLKRNYPRVIKALEYIEKKASPDATAGVWVWRAGAMGAAEALARVTGNKAVAEQLAERRLRLGESAAKLFASEISGGTLHSNALAAQQFARTAALPLPLPDDLASSVAERIMKRNVEPFRPVPAPETNAAGKAAAGAYSRTSSLVSEFGCEEIWNGKPDAGLDIASRAFEVDYNIRHDPWGASLQDRVPDGSIGRQHRSPSSLAAWNILPALAGFAVDLPGETIYLNPNLPKALKGELHIPIYTPAFHAWLDYNQSSSTCTLTITKVFPSKSPAKIAKIARRPAVDGKKTRYQPVLKLEQPFQIKEGARLEFLLPNRWSVELHLD